MRNAYEVLIWGETFEDTDALFSLLIRADSPEQAAAKADQILNMVVLHSCLVEEVVPLDL